MDWKKLKAEAEVEIPFHDVDMANIAWHGHYAKYLEIARCRLLDMFDYNYTQMGESGYFWPIVDMRIKYVRPSRFGQKIRVTAMLEEWEHRLKIRYVLYDVESGARLTKAYTSQVAVRVADGEMLLASPPVLADKLGIPVAERD
jgi:acyl-CoA thioester hydrolase